MGLGQLVSVHLKNLSFVVLYLSGFLHQTNERRLVKELLDGVVIED